MRAVARSGSRWTDDRPVIAAHSSRAQTKRRASRGPSARPCRCIPVATPEHGRMIGQRSAGTRRPYSTCRRTPPAYPIRSSNSRATREKDRLHRERGQRRFRDGFHTPGFASTPKRPAPVHQANTATGKLNALIKHRLPRADATSPSSVTGRSEAIVRRTAGATGRCEVADVDNLLHFAATHRRRFLHGLDRHQPPRSSPRLPQRVRRAPQPS